MKQTFLLAIVATAMLATSPLLGQVTDYAPEATATSTTKSQVHHRHHSKARHRKHHKTHDQQVSHKNAHKRHHSKYSQDMSSPDGMSGQLGR